MGQIVKRKKKGRPPKSDLASRARMEDPELEPRVRRSLRRRNVRYNFVDYDDFIDDDEYFEGNGGEEEEDERRREKKVKLVVKLNQGTRGSDARGDGASAEDEADEWEDEDEDEEQGMRKVVKKRRIGGGKGEDEEENEDHLSDRADDADVRTRPERRLAKGHSKELHTPSGTPAGAAPSVPLPDKKKLELILDKLQKKDTYGVYAEPVDPEELPDYHDVIEHPMDFLTVRKKLANGLYSTLEQIESDVFLICSNAMQYNAADTTYYKQARIIQELGWKKFQKLRTDYQHSERGQKMDHKAKSDIDSSEKELKAEQRMKLNTLDKKQMKKPISRPHSGPLGSDFSAGATLAIGEDLQNDSAANCEVPYTTDSILDGTIILAENNPDKAEELSMGKGLSAKYWWKPSAVDDNLRVTYMPKQPIMRVESIFTTFESEIKQLVAVGLHAENSYARSLARFAATLGPIAWKVAFQRIEQALPAGSKFGRGWVGEYEPLSNPILMTEKRLSKDFFLTENPKHNVESRKVLKIPALPMEDHSSNNISEMKSAPLLAVCSSGLRLNVASTVNHQQIQNPSSRISPGSGGKVVKQFELNSLPPTSQCTDNGAVKKHVDTIDTGALRLGEATLRNLNHPSKEVSTPEVVASWSKEMMVKSINSPRSVHFKHPDTSAVTGRVLSDKKIVSNVFDNSRLNSPASSIPNEMQRQPNFFLRQDQGLSDPVQLMQTLAEKVQKRQNHQKHSDNNSPAMIPRVSSLGRDNTPGNAATVAASVWMSVGGGGFKQAKEIPASPRNQISANLDSSYNSSHDPVQLNQIFAEKVQKQQNLQKHFADGRLAVTHLVPSTAPLLRKDTSDNAASAAASVWMSIGSGFKQATENSSSPRNQIPYTVGFPYSSQHEVPPAQTACTQGEFPASSGATYFQHGKGGSPLPPPFIQHQVPVVLDNVAQFPNSPMAFPQLMNANLARYQPQTPWRGIAPQIQQRSKQETLPPDLNIGFQSPGSPVRQSSSVKMEQQPDLALQL
ncbi:hypothetical protein SAY86_013297 [Trapa natans]|uniref:Bromo domain-containing protein n=1 Tax=Trapa natans TaxID=22666 RepID=A0AAN7RF31_TRANT|nr:hypothetical protein SAY86_013297 [Trapa natans]